MILNPPSTATLTVSQILISYNDGMLGFLIILCFLISYTRKTMQQCSGYQEGWGKVDFLKYRYGSLGMPENKNSGIFFDLGASFLKQKCQNTKN